jgi:hypothetical protein
MVEDKISLGLIIPIERRKLRKMKSFSIPTLFKSNLISQIKEARRLQDKMKKDFKPASFDFGPVEILISRHFGFCYGVENAVETAYRIIDENPDKRIFLLSEMIHNPAVNADLLDRGVKFIQDTAGNQLISWSDLLARIKSRTSRRKSSANSARDEDRDSFWQTKHRNSCEMCTKRDSTTGSSVSGTASRARARLRQRLIQKIQRYFMIYPNFASRAKFSQPRVVG